MGLEGNGYCECCRHRGYCSMPLFRLEASEGPPAWWSLCHANQREGSGYTTAHRQGQGGHSTVWEPLSVDWQAAIQNVVTNV